MHLNILGGRFYSGEAAPNTAPPGLVESPLWNLPRKENGDSVGWDTQTDRPIADMFDFRSVPSVTGTTHSVPGSKTFAQALTDANYGDVIEIAAGTTSTGNFTLPNKSWTSGYITIRTSGHASLPAVGSRIAVADASNMATIRCTNTNGIALVAAASASHWRFIGIIFTNESGVNNEDNAICSFSSAVGGGWSSKTTAPNNIIFDRCRWKPQGASMQKRGFYVAGKNIAFYGCRFDGFDDGNGGQGQDIATSEYIQRMHIDNCFLGAASQHLIWGGSGLGQLDGGYDEVWPQDIIVNRCEFKGDGSTTLNRTCLYETKNSERVVITACVFHGYRIGVGSHHLLLNLGAQENSAPLANFIKCRHITIRGNLFYDNDGDLISVHGNNGTPANEVGNHVEFSYNYGHSFPAGGESDSGALCYFVRSCYDVAYKNNILRGWPHSVIVFDSLGSSPSPNFGPRVYNNAFPTNSTYGWFSVGSIAMNTNYGTANWRVSNNASIDSTNEWITITPGGTPDNTGTNQTLANLAAFGFTDAANNDYSLAVGSPLLNAGSDGRNIGPNWTLFQANISGVETG